MRHAASEVTGGALPGRCSTVDGRDCRCATGSSPGPELDG